MRNKAICLIAEQRYPKQYRRAVLLVQAFKTPLQCKAAYTLLKQQQAPVWMLALVQVRYQELQS